MPCSPASESLGYRDMAYSLFGPLFMLFDIATGSVAKSRVLFMPAIFAHLGQSPAPTLYPSAVSHVPGHHLPGLRVLYLESFCFTASQSSSPTCAFALKRDLR
ncbi:MAG: hypothetical protein GYA24_09415 [Candidatus Lokiarchaeota archaeon]|nr:hypothetical protein [Candidatus Lokiarchaeota archaeon]